VEPAPGPAAASGFPVPWGLRFRAGDLRQLRQLTARWAAWAGLRGNPADDFVIAVNEIATNAVRYGSPEARMVLRVAGEGVAEAEICDSGCWRQPGVAAAGHGGLGLPLARCVCDEVEIQARKGGTTVTLRMSVPSRRPGDQH
jgi:serine/threonine-protein kinase RsbW